MKKLFKNNMQGTRVLIDSSQNVEVFKNFPDKDILNFYFEKDGRKFFFKSNSKYSLDASELLSYALDSVVDQDAVQILPAVYVVDGKTYNGVLSEDITRNNEKDEIFTGKHLLSIFETNTWGEDNKRKERFNTIEHYKVALNMIVGKKGNLEVLVESDFFVNLAKYLISGFIRADEDLHAHNIPIITKTLNENKKVITLGKLFDKSMSFLLKSHKVDIRDGFENLSYEQRKRLVENSLEVVGYPFQVNYASNKQTGRQFIAREIASLLLKYPELDNYYKAYKNINTKKLFANFKNENNYDFIKEADLDLASMVVNNSVRLIDQALEYEQMKNKGPMRFLNQAKENVIEL